MSDERNTRREEFEAKAAAGTLTDQEAVEWLELAQSAFEDVRVCQQ